MAKFSMDTIIQDVATVVSDIDKENSRQMEHKVVPISEIEFNPDNEFNKFDTEEDIEELARDIKENGMYHVVYLQRQEGRPQKYLLISGERRIKASIKNGETTVFATIAPPMSRDTMLYQMYGANIYARTLTNAQKIDLIKNLYAKLSEAGREGFNDKIGKLLQVDDRQVQKLVATSTKLVPELVDLVKRELLSINDAASYAPLPEKYQKIVAEVTSSLINNRQYLPAQRAYIKKYVQKIKGHFAFMKKDIAKENTKITKIEAIIEGLSASLPDNYAEAKIKAAESDRACCIMAIQNIEEKTEKRVQRITADFLEKIENGDFGDEKEPKSVGKLIDDISANIRALEKDGVDVTRLRAALEALMEDIKNTALY